MHTAANLMSSRSSLQSIPPQAARGCDFAQQMQADNQPRLVCNSSCSWKLI